MKKNVLISLILILSGIGILAFTFLAPKAPGSLKVKVEKADYIMPAAHQVYANQEALNGKYYLFKVLLTNAGKSKLENVKVSYRIPGYIDWTDLETVGEMINGQSVSIVCYPKFDDKIAEKMTESVERAEIKVDWDGASNRDIVEEAFSFKIMDRNTFMFTTVPQSEISSWSDIHDNDPLLACFVTPNDPIVKYYTQIVQEKILKGEAAGVSKDPKDAVRFLKGIYEATLLSHMVYSSTKMIPENLTDFSKLSQHNRLPREVITGNTGLCLELSLLYASMMSAGGLEPVIYLVPGHAYPGFKMNGQYFAIEATGIGGEGLGQISSAEQALNQGMKQLEEFFQKASAGDPRYTLVDIHVLNQQGVTAMNMKDDEFLRQKVDKIAENFQPSSNPNPRIPNDPRNLASNMGGSNIPNNQVPPSKNSASQTVSIPQGWQPLDVNQIGLRSLQKAFISPDYSTQVSIYLLPGSNLNDALGQLSNQIAGLGGTVNYQHSGNQIQGVTYHANGNFVWYGKGKQLANGYEIITVGSPEIVITQTQPIINQIYNTIK
jgi:hypothetical protein